MHPGVMGLLSPFFSNNSGILILLSTLYYNRGFILLILEMLLYLIFSLRKFSITVHNYKLFTDTTSFHTGISPQNVKMGLLYSIKYRYIGYLSIKYDAKDNYYDYSGFVYTTYTSTDDIQSIASNKKRYYINIGNISVASEKESFTKMHTPIDKFNILSLLHQHKVADYIYSQYKMNDKRVFTAVLYGKPGLGKSLTAYYLANLVVKEKSVIFITGYSFNSMTTSFRQLISHIESGYTYQMRMNGIYIILVDEIDIALTRIHKETIAPDKDSKYAIKDKEDFNSTMDAINLGIYPNIILIMTTNKTRDYFDDMDPSYLRYGRIDAHIDYNSLKCVERTKTMKKKCKYDIID